MVQRVLREREGQADVGHSPDSCHARLAAHELPRGLRPPADPQFHNLKLVYRRYVGLFFICGVDESDNELACLEAIHMFVEILDSYFGSVCELDLIYYFHKVYQVIDEVFLAGEVMEHRKQVVLAQLRAIDQLANQSQ